MTRRHFKHYIFIPFSVIVVLVTALWIATPFIAKHYLTKYVEEQQLDLSVGRLSVDFFPPKIHLADVSINDKKRDTLSLKRAIFEVKIWPLLTRTIRISEASVDGFNLDITQDNQDWIIAGIHLAQYFNKEEKIEPLEKKEQAPTEEQTPSWTISLPNLAITNSRFDITHQPDKSLSAVSDTIALNNVTMSDIIGEGAFSNLSWQGNISLSTAVNQATLLLDSQFQYAPDSSEPMQLAVQIKNASLPLSSFQHFVPSPFNGGQGTLTLDGNVTFAQSNRDNTLSYNLSKTNLNAVIENLKVNLSEEEALSTQSTRLSLTETEFHFISSERFTGEAGINMTSNRSAFTQAEISASYQNVNISNALSINKENGLLSIKNHELSTEIEGLNATESHEKQLSLASLKLTLEQLNTEVDNHQQPKTSAENVNINSQGLDIRLADNKRLASWGNANIQNLTVSQQASLFELALAQLNIDNLVVSERVAHSSNDTPLPPLATINAIEAKQIQANQDGASIDVITSDSALVNVIIDEQKQFENMVFVEEKPPVLEPTLSNTGTPKIQDAKKVINGTSNTETQTSTPEAESAFKAPYYVKLNRFDLTGNSSISVQDKSISPTLHRALAIDTLSLRNLNTQDKNQATELVLKARNGKYSTLNSNITIWPLADELTLKSKLVIKEAELPPYSSYIATALGYQIDSGHLDLDLTLNADNGLLDGEANILLRQFDLGGRQDSSSVVKAGAIPLNIAVGILKDSDDNIKLDIPLSGNVDSPEFGWSNFLILPFRKALYKVSSSYLLQTFVPYANVISIAQFAGEQLLKVRVEPLLFSAQNDGLDNTQTVFLEQLTALMKDKKSSQLKACAISSYQDFGLETPPKTLDNAKRSTGLSLAQRRADNLKEYLVNQGISSSRILLCAPEVDLSKSSQPRIELNF